VTLDVQNLAKWFRGTAPYAGGTGANSKTDNSQYGFTVYFSDRRSNRNASNAETGEYGYEDIVNPLSATGAPNGTLDAGENVKGSIVANVETQDLYGGRPSYNAVYASVPAGAPAGSPYILNNGANPPTPNPTSYLTQSLARVNRPIFFRRA